MLHPACSIESNTTAKAAKSTTSACLVLLFYVIAAAKAISGRVSTCVTVRTHVDCCGLQMLLNICIEADVKYNAIKSMVLVIRSKYEMDTIFPDFVLMCAALSISTEVKYLEDTS